MSALIKLHEAFVGGISFPFSQFLYNRKRILGKYREFLSVDRTPPEELAAMQLRRLKEVVSYAARHAPFYRKRFKELGFEPGDLKTLDDFKKIPPLSRQDVIDHYRELVDERLADSVEYFENSGRPPGIPIPFAVFRKHRLVKNTSSGSTGAPTAFFDDGGKTAVNWAQELRYKKWFGCDPGSREARMARVATEFLPGKKDLLIRRLLWNQLITPGTNLAERDLEWCVARMREFQPRVLWGYTSSLVSLANYLRKVGAAPGFQPRVLITWAAPLYEHERAILAEVFSGGLTNIYGARETGHISALCPHGRQHINQESVLVETAQTETALPELGGELVVTVLYDTPMPFLRYRMGDLGEVSTEQCACGRTTQIFGKLTGRTGEVFETRDGRILAPNFWCRFFMAEAVNGAINRFQVVYKAKDRITLRLEKGAKFGEHTEKYFEHNLNNNFDRKVMKIDIEYVPKILPKASGKYEFVVKEIVDS